MTGTPSPATDRLESALGAWLPGRRWFAGKSLPFRGPRVVHRIPYTDLGTSARRAEFLIVEVSPFQTGPPDHYLVPIATGRDAPRLPETSVILRTPEGTVHDALADPDFATTLTGDLLTGRSSSDAVEVRTEPGAGAGVPQPAAVRILSGEQSNTSVVIGDRAVLKVFRRLQQGENPELEMLRRLSAAGERHVPPLLASFGGPLHHGTATYGILQRYLTDAVDGWALALRSAAGAVREGTAPAAEDFATEALRMGRAVAAVHRTLARTAPTTTLVRDDLARIGRRMTRRLAEAVRRVPDLAPFADRLGAACAGLAEATSAVHAQRLHGDLHLGQLLRTAAGWSLIDFEGEPDRTFLQRRALEPLAKDVAAVMRSFDYAAHHEVLRSGRTAPADGVAREEAARAWADRSRSAFCEGYAEETGGDPRREQVLLRAYLIDKAVYELLYEIGNRPDWVPIPLRALQQLARTG